PVGEEPRVGLRVGRNLDVRTCQVHAGRALAGEAGRAARHAVACAGRADLLARVALRAGGAVGIGVAAAQAAFGAARGEQEEDGEEDSHGQKAKVSKRPEARSTPLAANSTLAVCAAENVL